MTMTPAQASELLTDVLASQRQGATWRMLASVYGYRTPQEMKKAARDAARISQRFLLEQRTGRGGS